MRQPLLYLLLTRFKNQILSWVRSPGKLIYSIFLMAMLVLVIVTGSQSPAETAERRELGELIAGLSVLYLLIFVLLAKRGFDSGASLFTLADVNLIFTAPFKSRSVLFFGLIQQMGTSLLLGLFLIFQYAWMQRLYGVSLGVLLLILFAYALTVFLAQLTAMVLYSFISNNESKAQTIKIFFYGLLTLYAGWLVIYLLQDTNLLLDKIAGLGSHWITFLFPVTGWISAIVAGALTGSATPVIFGVLLNLAYLATLICLVVFSRSDYYEDVLKTTEMNFSTITAQKQGRVSDAAPRKIRLGKTGLNNGQGASAFYYKHKIENRRSRVLLLNPQALIFILIIIAASLFMREIGLLGIFAFSTYMQMFTSALGRLVKEMTRPYIYLVPETSMKKLLQNVRESIPGTIGESLILFIPLGLILQLNLPEFVCCMLARFTFAFLFTAGNLLVERVFGTVSSKMLVFVFYFLSLIVMALPGIVLASLLAVFQVQIISTEVTVLLALSLTNAAVSLLVFYLCRNVLQYAELNNR